VPPPKPITNVSTDEAGSLATLRVYSFSAQYAARRALSSMFALLPLSPRL